MTQLRQVFILSSTKQELYLQSHNKGGLAQLARAFAWHAKGHRFDSVNLHQEAPEKGLFLFEPNILIVVI